MERYELRRLTQDDLALMSQLSRMENRNVHPDELGRFLALEGAYAFGLTRDGALAGMVTVLRAFEHGWLGPLVTTGGDDAVGTAVLLAQRAVEALQRSGVEVVEAEAATADAVVLERLGFERVRETLVLERAPAKAEPPGATEPMGVRHVLDVGALDAAAVGYGRKEYLLALASDFREGARVLSAGDDVRGYALARRSRRGYALGPLVTVKDDLPAAETLLRDSLAALATWPVVALAPEGSALLPELRRAGFDVVGRLTRMRAGKPPASAEPAASATQWLLGGRMTG